MSEPQPFDPGYDYEADKDIVERLHLAIKEGAGLLAEEAASEIRALRLQVKIYGDRINELRNTLDNLCGEDWELRA